MLKFMYFLKNYLVGFYRKIKGYFDFGLLHQIGSFLPSLTFVKLVYLYFASLFIYCSLLISYVYLIISVLSFFTKAFDTMIEYSNVLLSHNFLNDYVEGGVSTTQAQYSFLMYFWDILSTLGILNAFSLVFNLFLQLYTTLFLCYIVGVSLKIFWFICSGIYSFLTIAISADSIFKNPLNFNRLKKPNVNDFTSNNIDKFLPKG